MNLGNRQQLLSVVAIAAVVLLAGDRLVFSPLTKMWKERTSRIQQLKKSVSQGTALLDRESAIRDRWESMRTNALAGEASVAQNQLIKAFDRWSQESRTSISSIKPQWKHTPEDLLLLECRVDALGSLSALTRFLHQIEKDPLGLRLDTVELNTRDDNGQQIALALQVSGILLNTTSKP
ncbi:MAG TPA: hypothetical protein P5186_02165 [Candidatus Paceibacterota bacterium]|nr:hypothetical protein [Verrucomicrobiota bacterium]HRY46827.1 hypothetical protein [Candidatus Paceibacterota bacterium]